MVVSVVLTDSLHYCITSPIKIPINLPPIINNQQTERRPSDGELTDTNVHMLFIHVWWSHKHMRLHYFRLTSWCDNLDAACKKMNIRYLSTHYVDMLAVLYVYTLEFLHCILMDFNLFISLKSVLCSRICHFHERTYTEGVPSCTTFHTWFEDLLTYWTTSKLTLARKDPRSWHWHTHGRLTNTRPPPTPLVDFLHIIAISFMGGWY